MTDIQTPADGECRDGRQPPLNSGQRRPTDQHPPVTAIDGAHPNPSGHETGAIARWLALVLDGRTDWGSVDTWPTRHGVTRYRLVVFPPGIDTVERRLLRAWRAWPTWGMVLWLVSQIVLGAFVTTGAALATSIFAYLASGALLFARVAELRSRVRTLSVVHIAGFTDEESAAMFGELKSLVAELCHADAQRDRGLSTPADHEAAWWRVYDRMGQDHPGPATR